MPSVATFEEIGGFVCIFLLALEIWLGGEPRGIGGGLKARYQERFRSPPP
jgi:hypothetical protein